MMLESVVFNDCVEPLARRLSNSSHFGHFRNRRRLAADYQPKSPGRPVSFFKV